MNKILYIILISFIVSNCSFKPVVKHHGVPSLEKKQLSIKEVPIIFNERRLGNSKMSKKIVYEAFLYLVKNGLKRWLKIKIV